MKRVCPGSLQYAVVRIDPVAMVSHFNDRAALEEAQALRPQKYLVYLDHALDLPFSTTEWFRFQVSPIGPTLPPTDPSRGITPDMSIPIYPNEQHPTGRHPIHTLSPFPFANCYHWADSALTVRVRRNPNKYDDSAAVKITSSEHVRLMKLLGEDCRRIDECVGAREAELPVAPRAPRPSSPSSLDSRLSANFGDADMDFTDPNGFRTPDVEDDDNDGSLECSPESQLHQSVAGLLRMDIFSLSHGDDDEESLPLVDLWFDLEEHLSEAKIPSPLDLRREVDAVARIVRAARERHPDIRAPRRNGALDVDSEGSVSGDDLVDDEDCDDYMNGVDDEDDDDMWVTEDEEGDAYASAPVPAPVPVSVPVPVVSHPKPVPTAKYNRSSRFVVRPACSPPSESPLSTSPNTDRRVLGF